MALPRFKVVNAESFDEAAKMLAEENGKAKVIGGGTDLLHGYKDNIYKEYPETVVNLRSAEEGAYIEEKEDGLHISALTSLHEIETSALIKEKYAVLSDAAYTVASPQIRNASTLGGNICQEPRCWYYRNADNLFHCMRKGGEACPAFIGRKDIHSVCGAMKVKASPCQEECPNHTPIPYYFDLIRKGDIEGAAKVMAAVNPLMAMTGRVCPHTCTSACNRNNYDEEVAIREIEREVGDYFLNNAAAVMPEKSAKSGRKVAIVGAGPAGLTAAYYLTLCGHEVTVYDMNETAGGMLVYGIPSYRLPKDKVAQNVKVFEDMGVKFVMNTKIGKDIALEQLQKDNDAVLLGIGAWIATGVGCKGDDAEGVVGGIDLLGKIARKEDVDLAGKVVAVVGGGNTAMDACRSAVRLGAKKVYNVYRRTQAEMPADLIEILEATEEGVDFRYLVTPDEIISEGGKVKQMKLQKMQLGEPDESGRRRPVAIEGEFEYLDVDVVVAAIGQAVDPAGLEAAGVTKRNWIAADEACATQLEGVFAAGDGAQGPATAIKAIAAARTAVASINEYLGTEARDFDVKQEDGFLSYAEDCLEKSPKALLAQKPVAERTLYDEDCESLGFEAAQKEACRCFDCGCIAACPSDMAPAIIAMDAVVRTTKRDIPAEEFFAVGVYTSTILDDDELVKEIFVPANGGAKSAYMKYRHRQAIDFPLFGAAVRVKENGGLVEEARIVLGAAAPVPVRAKSAEAMLAGKELTEETAAAAAEEALAGAVPFKDNAYKVQAAKAYIKRALLAAK